MGHQTSPTKASATASLLAHDTQQLQFNNNNNNSSSSEPDRTRAADPDVFWADHSAWLQSVKDSTPAKITVDEPIQQGRSLTNPNPPVTYAIATESSRVRRRYSDFEVVRAFLQSRYIGILIPGLPEKRVMGNTNDEFLQERARGLQQFIQRIVANPYLFADAVIKVFLRGDAAEWEVCSFVFSLPPILGYLSTVKRCIFNIYATYSPPRKAPLPVRNHR